MYSSFRLLTLTTAFLGALAGSSPTLAAPPLEDYRDYSRASAKELMLRRQANGLDQKTMSCLGGGCAGNATAATDLDEGAEKLIKASLLPVGMLLEFTGGGLKSMNDAWDKASLNRLRQKVGKKIRGSDKEWAGYVEDIQRDQNGTGIILLGHQHKAATREAMIALKEGDADNYLRILKRGVDIDDDRAVAMYTEEMARRPAQKEEFKAYLAEGCKAKSALYRKYTPYSSLSAVLCSNYKQLEGSLYALGNPTFGGLSDSLRDIVSPALYRRQLLDSMHNRRGKFTDGYYCIEKYGTGNLTEAGCKEKKEADVWQAMKSDAVTVERERCVACAGLWYDWFSDYFTDSGRPAMFDVALLLREGQPKDDDVLELIRGAVTTSGGRAHTLPIIAQWAQEQQAPGFLTAIGLALETYKAYPDAVTWYTRAAEAGETAAMRNLAALLDSDKLEKPDSAASLQWLEKASQAGDMTARAGLGYRLLNGQRVTADVARGGSLLKEAADAGDVQGTYLLGRAYALGEGLPKQPEQARPLLAKAAAEGHEAAKSLLQSL
ncbi:MAG: tetratricopeptide repeat protein [Fluviicoccus sp.]|uniref:tetratricopeptide repeat protein n=1 Tax=Fluviicoccus sp. TaxID=2003552 RepID=UPI0027226881|nr:tetratricopeptide repeat protein [Fluviicoccus sp.]MDO8331696.1 tetratricopeptide repeat protein [Fluviicoccus sp.]